MDWEKFRAETAVEDYTGYAKISADGKLEAVASYNKVGMYKPCLFVENGIAKALTLGGFRNASGTPINKKVVVFVPNNN